MNFILIIKKRAIKRTIIFIFAYKKNEGNMKPEFFNQQRPHKGLTFQEYFELHKKKVELIEQQNPQEIDGYNTNYIKLNYHRTLRILKTYKVNEELCSLIKKISQPQLWLVLTEHWCGDSAQILPYISKIAECNQLIDLRILERDKNLDIMDLYLTNGTRSIPKLIAFDVEGNELFTWGPRPKEAQELILNAKKEGKSKEEFIEQLHLWYAKDGGQSIEKEFYEIISNL